MQLPTPINGMPNVLAMFTFWTISRITYVKASRIIIL